jgi:hypothetical protein
MCCNAGCSISKRKDSKSRMQNLLRFRFFSLLRRLLFPYNGEDPLSAKQGLRVILAWTLVFPLPLSLCTVAITLLAGLGTQGMLGRFIFAFLSGAFIFGMLSVLIVFMSNRAAHIRQAWKAQNGRS